MYATIEFKGKQYKAEKDVVLTVDKLDAEKGSKIDIDTVLLVSDGDQVQVKERLSSFDWSQTAVYKGTR